MGKQKVITVVGPTASGKTSLSIALAKDIEGEIISADSRQIYKGLDLGSGKVTEKEMGGIPHHMLDVADPRTVYSASDYVRDARPILEDIIRRGKIPIIAGGSFFYIDALLGRITFPGVAPNKSLRAKLETMSNEELYTRLKNSDPRRALLIDKGNKRRLIRAIEVSTELGAVPLPHTVSPYEVLTLGIAINRDTLFANIHTRLISRIDAGMLEEVERLHREGLSYDRLESLGLEYRFIAQHLRGELAYCEMINVIETKIRQFAKRQMTWLKRDTNIIWVQKDDEVGIKNKINSFLS